MAQGEFALVRDNLEKGLHKATSSVLADSDLHAMLADAAVQQSDLAALQEYAPLLEGAATSLEHKLYLATAHRAWGVLYRLEGQYEEAQARLEQAAALFKDLDTSWQLGRTHFELGQLAADRSDAAGAKQHYARALTLFEEMGAVPDAARVRAALPAINDPPAGSEPAGG